MKYIFLIILSVITITATSQRNIYSPLLPLNVNFVQKSGTDSLFNFFISQTFLDSLKNAYGIAINANTAANTASTTALNATNIANGAVQVNASQSLTITAHSNSINTLQTNLASTQVDVAINTSDITANKKTTDSIVSNWPSGGGFTVPPPYNVTVSQNIPLLPYGTDIFVKCNSCTLTFNAVQQSGWKYTIHNIGTTTISFNANSLNKVNFLSKIGTGQRPIQVTYQTTNTIEIH